MFCTECGIEIKSIRSSKKYCDNCCKLIKKISSYSTKAKAKSTVLGYLRYLTYGERRQYFTEDDLFCLYKNQHGLCAISGVPMTHLPGKGDGSHCPTNISIDRIDSSGTYRLDNIQLVCYVVNSMKNIMSVDELRWWCKQIIKGEFI